MATTFATVVGLGGASLSSTSSRLTSGFVKSPVIARNPLRQAMALGNGGKVTCFQRDWLRTDFSVIGFGLIGWIAPSSIPAIDGKSLTGLFFESIGAELAHFPHSSCSYFTILVMADYVAPGAVYNPHFWANWLQGKD